MPAVGAAWRRAATAQKLRRIVHVSVAKEQANDCRYKIVEAQWHSATVAGNIEAVLRLMAERRVDIDVTVEPHSTRANVQWHTQSMAKRKGTVLVCGRFVDVAQVVMGPSRP